MKQLFEQPELIGKTISQILIPETSYQNLFIKFTDNSFVVFEKEDATNGYGYPREIIIISDMKVDNTYPELVELGLVTKKDYECAIQQEETKYEQEEISKSLNKKISIETEEKELLKKLKNKYENT